MPQMTFSHSDLRRAAALKRVRDAAAADGLSPARIAELESRLMSAFAIKNLMASWFGEHGD